MDRFTYFLSTCVPILEKFQVGLITFCFHVSYFGIDVRYIKFVLSYISAFLNDIFQEISSITAWLNFKILWLSFDNINYWGDRLMQPSRMHYQHAIKKNYIVMSFVRKTFYFYVSLPWSPHKLTSYFSSSQLLSRVRPAHFHGTAPCDKLPNASACMWSPSTYLSLQSSEVICCSGLCKLIVVLHHWWWWCADLQS